MKRQQIFILAIGVALAAVLVCGAGFAQAQGPKPGAVRAPQASLLGTSFTYQGRLKYQGNYPTGAFDFEFKLFDAISGGNQVGSTVTKDDVNVNNGLFIVLLDFGNVFDGTALAVEVGARLGSSTGSYTVIGRHVLWAKPYALALPGLYTQPNDTSPNVIGGYRGNSVSSGVFGGTIGGGGANGWTNGVTDHYGTVSGGYNNQAGDSDTTTDYATYATVGGGANNNATNSHATIGGGSSNSAGGLLATIGGGLSNSAGGVYATVGGGDHNSVSGLNATVPGGARALASHQGEMAYANGMFAATGDAQTSVYVLRNTTTNTATPTELFLDGVGARLTIASNRALAFNIQVVAFSSGGISAAWEIRGLIDRTGSSTTMNAAPIKTTPWIEDPYPAWDVNVEANDTYDALVIKVTGDTFRTIRWVATVRTTEVNW